MDEIWIRIGLVATAFVIAALVIGLVRLRHRRAPRRIESTGLETGVYLFTSETCADCGPVRDQMKTALGVDGFVELSWDGQPGVFESLGITAVPATLVVVDDGSGTLWPGPADRALATLRE